MKRIAILLAFVAGIHSVGAHEGHTGEPGRPIYSEIESGGAIYRIGLAFVPHEPVVGEDVRFEVRVVELSPQADSPTAAERPVTGEPVELRILSADRSSTITPQLVPANSAGTYRTTVQFDRSGSYVVSVGANAKGKNISATFAVAVAAGPVWRTTLILDALVLLLVVAICVAMWRRAAANDRPVAPRLSAAAVAGVAALFVAHAWVGPALGNVFLPQRPDAAIDWKSPAASGPGDAATHALAEAQRDTRQSLPHDGGTVPAGVDVVATVVPAPGAVADVVVPLTSRVLLDPATRLGATVRAGQTLATLEHHYILHDAVHLINTRWPLMAKMLETKRQALDSELLAVRLRAMQKAGAVPEWAVQTAEGKAAEAKLEMQRAQRLLAMHDTQITQSQIVKRPLQAPISGMIDNVSFVQGQLAYENDKLFTIVDLSNLWVELRIPERLAASWRPPRRMSFASTALPDARLEGTLARVANQVDPTSRTIAYFFQVRNPSKQLRVGMRLSPVIDDRATMRERSDVAPAAFRPPSPAGAAAAGTFTATGTVLPKPELIAQAAAPIWGRIEFTNRRLNVGDTVRKDEVLANVVLELSIDERYPMEARMAEIDAELELSKVRKAQAEQQHSASVAQLKAAPDDALRRQEVEVTERMVKAASEEESLLTRQQTVFQGVMKRRDPRITPVPAPITGVITEVGFRPGELNTTGEFRRLFTIVDPSRVWVEAQVFEHQSAIVLTRFKRAWFVPAGGGPEISLGRPVTMSTTVDPQTRTVRVIFEVPNPGGRLKLGGTGQVNFEWN